MTNLIRCRGAVSEIATLFDAEPDPDLLWAPTIWPGEHVLAVTASAGSRRLQTIPWGLPAELFLEPKSPSHRATIFARDLIGRNGGLVAPDLLERCLIIIEACASPEGEDGQQTRTWSGLWDEPLVAWAGLCRLEADEPGCAGLLTPANPLIGRVSGHMPFLLTPEGQAAWLDGCSPLVLPPSWSDGAWYLERSDERWSNGDAEGQ